MVPCDQQIIQTKVLLTECYVAESHLADLLFNCWEKYSSGMSIDETLKLKDLSDKVHGLIHKIEASIDMPPDKLPVYP